MAQATLRTRQKFHDPSAAPTRQSSHHAFQSASTCGRTLDVQQYNAGSTNFLTDLLFFNLADSPDDLQLLLTESSNIATTESCNPLYETARHSWHVATFYNPNFCRPLLFQIAIQRPECFTVYPSEGFLKPGQRVTVTFGVRPLASAMAAAQSNDAPEWTTVRERDAQLPLVPFLVRYRFAAAQPLWTMAMHDPSKRPQHPSTTTADVTKTETERLLDYHWKQPVPAHQIRTIHLSAHVHAHYNLFLFLQATCWRFSDLINSSNGPIFIAPALQEMYPTEFALLENAKQGVSSAEGPCRSCGKSWYMRDEELLNAYVVMRAECAWHEQQCTVRLDNVREIVHLAAGKGCDHSNKLMRLVQIASFELRARKACPLYSLSEKREFLIMERQLDKALSRVDRRASEKERGLFKKKGGVFSCAPCTNYCFDECPLTDGELDNSFMDEYCKPERPAIHYPGRYCLGPQEDPNHLEENVIQSEQLALHQGGLATDLFMNDTMSAFKAGLCMANDPRSLIVHGLFDKVAYPGTIIRCAKVLSPSLCPQGEMEVESSSGHPHAINKSIRIVETSECNVYFMMQNGVDLAAIHETDRICSGGNAQPMSPVHHVSLFNFVHNVPAPGAGKFALSGTMINNSFEALPEIVALNVQAPPIATERERVGHEAAAEANIRAPAQAPLGPHRNILGLFRVHRLEGAQLGFVVVFNRVTNSVFVDRKLIIGTQWLCISLTILPLFLTLCARCLQRIPARPLDQDLGDLSFESANNLRYLSEAECGFAAIALILVWTSVGRWAELHTGRDLIRMMLDHTTPDVEPPKSSQLRRCGDVLHIKFTQTWDRFCPLFLQRKTFTPHWNRRGAKELQHHFSFWRYAGIPSHERSLSASAGQESAAFGDNRDKGVYVGSESSTRNILVGLFVALGSFYTASPIFGLNILTIFLCAGESFHRFILRAKPLSQTFVSAAVSLGMSVSLYSIEKSCSTRINVTSSTTALLTHFNLVSIIMLSVLLGQLVGSSGNTMFLAEFVVTSMSLILGGAVTISARAVKSWFFFFCLSGAAFWGYVFGRVALMENVQRKRSGYSTSLLSKSVGAVCCVWLTILFLSSFYANACVEHDGQAQSR
jgi:hypothetical protein